MYPLLFVSLLWAFSFGLIKGQLTGIDPILVSTIRLLLCLATFILFIKRTQPFIYQGKMFGLGVVQFGIMYWAYIYSYQFLPAYLVAVFTIFTPLYVFLISAIITRKLVVRWLLPVVLSIIGAAIIVFQPSQTTSWLTGFIILQVANIAFAIGQVGYKKLTEHQATNHIKTHLSNMAVMYLGASTFMSTIAVINGSFAHLATISTQQWLILIYLGVIASGACFALWNYGAKQVSSTQLAIMNNGYIPFAVIFSLTLFGESADMTKLLVGGTMIVVSISYASKYEKQQKIQP